MKTIENFALETSNKKGNQSCKGMVQTQFDNGVYEGIKLGVEFAQKWIPISEELPENTYLFELPNFELIRFLVRGTNGKEWVANRRHQKDSSIIPYSFFSCETDRYFSVTHWQPINLK